MIDQFTKWPVAIPIPDRTSNTIATAIFKHWICEKGVPFRILSDQGRELISQGMKQLCAKLGIQKGRREAITRQGIQLLKDSTDIYWHHFVIFDKEVSNWDEFIIIISSFCERYNRIFTIFYGDRQTS